jgi:hypothetical protein
MKHARTLVSLQWPGLDSLKAAREAMEKGSELEIELPEGTHYTLCRHLAGELTEALDIEGGADVLEAMASVHGLEELARLRTAVKRRRYRARLTSPDPLLHLCKK